MRNIAKHFVVFMTGILISYVCYAADVCTPGGVVSCLSSVSCQPGYYKAPCPHDSALVTCFCCPSGFQDASSGVSGLDNCVARKTCDGYNPCSLTYGGVSICNINDYNWHLELVNGDLTCVENNKDCSEFPIYEDVPYPFDVSGNWQQTEQRSIAEWDPDTNDKWDFSLCYFRKEDVDIPTKNCRGIIQARAIEKQCIGNARTGFKIKHNGMVNASYCSECGPGKKPDIVEGHIGMDSQYHVPQCIDVEVPYYSTGCNFGAFGLNISTDIDDYDTMADCHQQCSAGWTVTEPGASSCVIDSATLYNDDTGTFYFQPGAVCH